MRGFERAEVIIEEKIINKLQPKKKNLSSDSHILCFNDFSQFHFLWTIVWNFDQSVWPSLSLCVFLNLSLCFYFVFVLFFFLPVCISFYCLYFFLFGYSVFLSLFLFECSLIFLSMFITICLCLYFFLFVCSFVYFAFIYLSVCISDVLSAFFSQFVFLSLFVFLHCWFVYGKVSAWLLTLRWSTVSIQKNWKNFEKISFLRFLFQQ